MKKIAFITAFTILSLVVNAQSVMDKLFDKYSGTDGITSVYISKYMFDMFRNNNETPKEQQDMQKVISNLNCIKILATEKDTIKPPPVNLFKEIMKVMPANVYKEIMVIKEKDSDVRFYTRDVNGKVVELLLVVGGTSESVLISIQGDIDMKNISKLANSMNIEGMQNLEKIDKH